jgi:hypothetical protein
MLTLNTRVASVTAFTISPVRVNVAAPAERPFAQFLRALLRALGAMHT